MRSFVMWAFSFITSATVWRISLVSLSSLIVALSVSKCTLPGILISLFSIFALPSALTGFGGGAGAATGSGGGAGAGGGSGGGGGVAAFGSALPIFASAAQPRPLAATP